MKKEYCFNGKNFILKPLSLGLMKDIMPLLVRLRKLIYNYTSDIDMTEVNKARQNIADLEKAKEQLSEQLEGNVPSDERLHIINRINSLNEKITLYKNELDNNNDLSEKIRLYNECSALAVYELFTDPALIKPALGKLLEGENTVDDINIEDPGSIKFVSEVMTGFFLYIRKNKTG